MLRYESHKDLEGYYLDGQTATRQRAIVFILQDGMQITTETGAIRWWPYEEIRQNQDCCGKDQIRLELGGEIPEVLILPSHLFFEELQKIRPKNGKHFQGRASRRRRIIMTLLAALAVVVITGTLYLWGIPTMAYVAASYVPISWEEHLGDAVLEHLAPEKMRCTDPSRSQILDGLTQALLSSVPQNPYQLRIIVVNERIVNAFALPGGTIILFQGLLDRTESPEELAGILAHELQHILLRHATQALLQEASMGLLLAAMTGDTKGVMGFGLEGAKALGAMRYSRQSEEEADAEAVKMLLASGVGTGGMIRFFEKLKKGEGKIHDLPTYLSTHPSLDGRIARLKSLSREGPQKQRKGIVVEHWNRIRFFCPSKVQTPF